MRIFFVVAAEMGGVYLLQRLLGSPGVSPRDFAIVYAPLFVVVILPSVTYLWHQGQGADAVVTVTTSAAVALVLVLIGRSSSGPRGKSTRWFGMAGGALGLIAIAIAGLVAIHL